MSTGMETVGPRVGEQREGMGWYSLGGRERGHLGGTRWVFLCVFGVWSVGGGAVNGSLGPLAKTPVGLTWQPHEAAWQEESCI